MPKFFVQPDAVIPPFITITGEDVNHIKNVLRFTEEQEILINDRQGNDYECIIYKIESDAIKAKINKITVSDTEPCIKTILFQSLIKGEKMDFVIQKSVEIGVTHIVPIHTRRCVVKVESDKKIQTKLQRWNKISESAAKQSGRGIVPVIEKPMDLEQALQYAKIHTETACIPYENEYNHTLKTFLRTNHPSSIGIFIGPEGGFTEKEITFAIEQGIFPITLGKRILRSETAGLVTLANIMYEMGGI